MEKRRGSSRGRRLDEDPIDRKLSSMTVAVNRMARTVELYAAEGREDRKQAAEDRRQAAEDRKQLQRVIDLSAQIQSRAIDLQLKALGLLVEIRDYLKIMSDGQPGAGGDGSGAGPPASGA